MSRKVYLTLFVIFCLIIIPFYSSNSQVKTAAESPSIQEKTKDMEKYEGFFTFYRDLKEDKIWLEIPKKKFEFIYLVSLTTGIGSNDIGLDRGMSGRSRIVYFEQAGRKVLLVQPNYKFRASSNNYYEIKAVKESFAESILWGFEIYAVSKKAVLVDATNFFLRDGFNVKRYLSRSRQGNFKLDKTRSTFYLPNTKSFPENTEFEVILTFTSEIAGNYLRQTVPTPEAVTVRERYSFVKLPAPGYKPRVFDPRMPFNYISYYDYTAPLGEPLEKKLICRHRLEKKDPSADISEPIKPIIYYVDRGIPEPVRTAVLEGASWWNKVFESAGFKNAFQVKLLPKGVSPLDIRYNVIQWVNRLTRGWSYGGSVVDPRTGEIIKGHVSLGSLRVRQDYLLAEGLLAPYKEKGKIPSDMKEMALMRIRQLACHEVGHTLGLRHNYASSVNDRASVMDYPAPLVLITKDGRLDLSNAYRPGPGRWDELSIKFGYSDFPDNVDEKEALNKIIDEGFKEGLYFMSDRDATYPGASHPLANQWDNGKDPVKMLKHEMEVRRIALEQFGERNIRFGMPLSLMEDVLVPVYFHHRYQLIAAVKTLGGVYYTYTLRGDGQKPLNVVPPDKQREALKVILETISPEELSFPESIMNKLPPRPSGYSRNRELFTGKTGPIFDPIEPASRLARFTVSLLLQYERAGRLIDLHEKNKDNPGLIEVIDEIFSHTWFKKTPSEPYRAELSRACEEAVVNELMALADNPDASYRVRAVASYKLNELLLWIKKRYNSVSGMEKAHYFEISNIIERFLNRPFEPDRYLIRPVLPPGSPIGTKNF
ncbi:peptidase [candidate division KSB1 bacterium]|nr:MAG: peptidase [candidate division KSB1 bacterium]